ncbi:cobalamin biosynthesis protein [Candidatus Poribacteria bacterium]|nr:cobalamin biosynthesis protein [Candidatus Poribacteria bacterium]
MGIAIIAITKEGAATAQMLSQSLSCKTKIFIFTEKGSLKKNIKNIFDKEKFDGLIFIMSLGIVVRIIAPYLKNKYVDPAVVVVDEARRFAVSALSGHEGGANVLAYDIARILDAEPIITTATETNKKIIIGIGCRRNISKEAVISAIKDSLNRIKCSIDKIKCAATVDLKINEKGLIEACIELNIPLRIISSYTIKNFAGNYERSSFVKEKIGIEGVSEPCALIAGRNAKLILKKQIMNSVTVAIAREK